MERKFYKKFLFLFIFLLIVFGGCKSTMYLTKKGRKTLKAEKYFNKKNYTSGLKEVINVLKLNPNYEKAINLLNKNYKNIREDYNNNYEELNKEDNKNYTKLALLNEIQYFLHIELNEIDLNTNYKFTFKQIDLQLIKTRALNYLYLSANNIKGNTKDDYKKKAKFYNRILKIDNTYKDAEMLFLEFKEKATKSFLFLDLIDKIKMDKKEKFDFDIFDKNDYIESDNDYIKTGEKSNYLFENNIIKNEYNNLDFIDNYEVSNYFIDETISRLLKEEDVFLYNKFLFNFKLNENLLEEKILFSRSLKEEKFNELIDLGIDFIVISEVIEKFYSGPQLIKNKEYKVFQELEQITIEEANDYRNKVGFYNRINENENIKIIEDNEVFYLEKTNYYIKNEFSRNSSCGLGISIKIIDCRTKKIDRIFIKNYTKDFSESWIEYNGNYPTDLISEGEKRLPSITKSFKIVKKELINIITEELLKYLK